MHIGFVYPFFPPELEGFGISSFLKNFTSLLRKKKKIKVTIVCQSYNSELKEEIDGVKIFRVQIKRKQLWRNNIKIDKVVKAVNQKDPIDLIEVADFGSVGVSLLKQSEIPVILRCHTPSFIIDWYCPNKKPILSYWERRLEKEKLKLAKHLIFPYKGIEKTILMDLRTEGKKQVLPYTLFDFESIKRLSKTRWNKDTRKKRSTKVIKLLFVGRLEELKNIEVLVKAVIYANQQLGAKLHLTLVGPETSFRGYLGYKDYLLKKVVKDEIDSFMFKGLLVYQEVMKLYGQYDVFAMPSRHEAVGYAVIEAMSQGLPIVASRVGGLKQLVDNNKTGLLYSPVSDFQQLARKLTKFYKQPRLIKQFGGASRKKLVQIVNDRSALETNFKYYQTIINK